MVFDFFGRKNRLIARLQGEKFDLERKLFEAEQWCRIGEEKVKYWVEKHDTILIKLKEIEKKHD